MKSLPGLSLVEFLIILAILSIVAAIAIPSLMMSRLAANEASAIQGCRLIASAEIAYAAAHEQKYTDIPTLIQAELLDQKFGGEEAVRGYRYDVGDVRGTDIDGSIPDSFGFLATPASGAGRFVYAIAPDQVVRYQGPAAGFSLPSGVTPGDPVESRESADVEK